MKTPPSDVEHGSDARFAAASRLWEQGQTRRAFRLFLLGAKDGDSGCQVNVGYFYDEGIGVKRNRTKALLWYRRASRAGSASAACNIGVVLDHQGKHTAASKWFQRALRMGDDDAALHLASHYLKRGDTGRAMEYLELAAGSNQVCEGTREKAKELLRDLSRPPIPDIPVQDGFDFRAVDMHVESGRDLEALTRALRRPLLLQTWTHRRTHTLHAALPKGAKDPSNAILSYCRLLNAVPRAARAAWNHARRREFDIGVDAGVTPCSAEWTVSVDALEAAVRLGAQIRITVYAPEGAGRSVTKPRRQK